MADTLQQLLRERAEHDTIAVKYGDRSWTWREHIADANAQAAALIAAADPARPLHVGVLLGNTPDMLTALAAAALGGYVLCGINTTRRGDALARDIARVDCQFLITDAEHRHAARRTRPARRHACSTPRQPEWAELLAGAPRADAAPRGRGRRHLHDDLHLGHQRRPQGRAGDAPDGAVRRVGAGRAVRADARRRLLPVDAAVPLQRRAWRAGRRRWSQARRWCPRRSPRRASSPTSAATAPPT